MDGLSEDYAELELEDFTHAEKVAFAKLKL